MIPLMINKATRILGKLQGYIGLPIRDETLEDGTEVMVSLWEPSPIDLKRLNDGASVKIKLMGTRHPPIKVEVDASP